MPNEVARLHAEFVAFALEKAAAEPVAKRIRLYRAAADLVGDETLSNQLAYEAQQMEQADRRCREFVLKIQPK